MDYREASEKVARDMGLPKDVVLNSYKSFWKFVKGHIVSLPLKQALSEEEFSKLKTCFNIPSLGKFGCPYDRYQRLRKEKSFLEETGRIKKVKDEEA